MQFDEAVDYLLSLGHETVAIKLGLQNTTVLLENLGNPHRSFKSVQIAGTNGKGSTAVFLDSICRNAGVRTGLYTSPHLVSVTERIGVDGVEIAEEHFGRLATEVRDAAESLVRQNKLQALPTFFEHVTAIALMAFKEAGVELAILETGMGGRLDATTVAEAQVVGITPISLDHQKYLGNSLAEIAFEKAAAIRPGVAAVVAEQPAEAMEVIEHRLAECEVNAAIADWAMNIEGSSADGRFLMRLQTPQHTYQHIQLGLRGRHQITNAAVAVRVAEKLREQGIPISNDAIAAGLETAQHSGRLELIPTKPTLLLDGAHNVSGARALREYLDEFADGPLSFVFGAMRDKQLERITSILFREEDTVVLTSPVSPRAASVDELETVVRQNTKVTSVLKESSACDALTRARAITSLDSTICVTGSLYLVGEIKELLQAPEVTAEEFV